jgi:2-polyprenyl-3-methyl-5-hydroxy-6-metoxy-1,4-benzoquinol methylase
MDHSLYHLVRYKFAQRLSRPTDHVLDLGCGTGYGTRFLAGHVKSATGIDPDVSSIEIAKANYERRNLRYYPGTSFEYRVDDPRKKPTLITCFEMIEHVERREAYRILHDAIFRIGSERSVTILSTPRFLPFEERSVGRQEHHVHEFTHADFTDFMYSLFPRPLIFTQTDEIISAGNPSTCWTYIGVGVIS